MECQGAEQEVQLIGRLHEQLGEHVLVIAEAVPDVDGPCEHGEVQAALQNVKVEHDIAGSVKGKVLH